MESLGRTVPKARIFINKLQKQRETSQTGISAFVIIFQLLTKWGDREEPVSAFLSPSSVVPVEPFSRQSSSMNKLT